MENSSNALMCQSFDYRLIFFECLIEVTFNVKIVVDSSTQQCTLCNNKRIICETITSIVFVAREQFNLDSNIIIIANVFFLQWV